MVCYIRNLWVCILCIQNKIFITKSHSIRCTVCYKYSSVESRLLKTFKYFLGTTYTFTEIYFTMVLVVCCQLYITTGKKLTSVLKSTVYDICEIIETIET